MKRIKEWGIFESSESKKIPHFVKMIASEIECFSGNGCGLHSLKGIEFPEDKVFTLYLTDNKLSTLDGSPEKAYSVFVSRNKLTTLKGGPKQLIEVNSASNSFRCDNNLLISLEGAPEIVNGDFSAANNRLINLKGGPRIVGGDFDVHANPLWSLEGAPEQIQGRFKCKWFSIPEGR